MLAAVCLAVVIGDATAHSSFLRSPIRRSHPSAEDPWALGARDACLTKATYSTCLSALEGIRRIAWLHIKAEAEHLQDDQLRDLRFHEPLQPRPAYGGGLRATLPQCSGAGSAGAGNATPATVVYYRHLFKSGGTSIMQNLQELSGGDCSHSKKWKQDGFCDELAQNLGPARSSNPPLMFTFVRDPIARLISGYSEIEVECRNAFKSNYTMGTTDRAVHFLAGLLEGWFNLHTATQSEFVLGHLRTCPVPFDYLGVLENFDSDWDKLAERLHCDGGRLPYNRSLGVRTASADPLGTTRAMSATLVRAPADAQPAMHAAPPAALAEAEHGPRRASLRTASTSAMREALRQEGGALMRIVCWFLLPDYIIFDYPLPTECQDLHKLASSHSKV